MPTSEETEAMGKHLAEQEIFWRAPSADRKSWHRTLLEIRSLPDA